MDGLNLPRFAFAYAGPVRTFLADIDKHMEEIGWRFEGPESIDGAVGGWIPEDYDAANPPSGLTDLAVMRAYLNKDGKVEKVELVATGNGYNPYDETVLEGDNLAKWCIDWFKDRIWWHTDED